MADIERRPIGSVAGHAAHPAAPAAFSAGAAAGAVAHLGLSGAPTAGMGLARVPADDTARAGGPNPSEPILSVPARRDPSPRVTLPSGAPAVRRRTLLGSAPATPRPRPSAQEADRKTR